MHIYIKAIRGVSYTRKYAGTRPGDAKKILARRIERGACHIYNTRQPPPRGCREILYLQRQHENQLRGTGDTLRELESRVEFPIKLRLYPTQCQGCGGQFYRCRFCRIVGGTNIVGGRSAPRHSSRRPNGFLGALGHLETQ